MQKTEKPPKRSESQSSSSTTTTAKTAMTEKMTTPRLPLNTAEDFKTQLVKTIQNYLAIAQNVQNTNVLEPLTHNLTGLQFCFEKLHLEGEQLVNVSQGALASLARTQSELEKDPQVRQDKTAQADLENLQQYMVEMHHWLSNYQSEYAFMQKILIPVDATPDPRQKQYKVNQPLPKGYTVGSSGRPTYGPSSAPHTIAHPATSGSTTTGGGQAAVLTPQQASEILQQLINALNVTTVSAFVLTLKNLNDFLTANPGIQISLQQFYSLFDQLDHTFQALPEATGHGTTQRQAIAAMLIINRQVNQLYGFLMSHQIIGL